MWEALRKKLGDLEDSSVLRSHLQSSRDFDTHVTSEKMSELVTALQCQVCCLLSWGAQDELDAVTEAKATENCQIYMLARVTPVGLRLTTSSKAKHTYAQN